MEHGLPTASVARSSQATPARRRGQPCTPQNQPAADPLISPLGCVQTTGATSVVFADAGYQGVAKRPENQGNTIDWQVAMRPGKRRALSESDIDQLRDRVERLKAQVRAKGEHAFRVVKRQFGYTKVRYRGLSKNTAQLRTLFALANLWMARRALMNTG
jgi:IS5 family transposase